MTENERAKLLNQYIDLLNSCESEKEVKKSAAVKKFENKYKDDAELKEVMKTAKNVKILFLNGEIE